MQSVKCEHRDAVFLFRGDVHYLRVARRRIFSERSCKARDIGTEILEMTQIFDIDLGVAGRVRRFIYIVK